MNFVPFALSIGTFAADSHADAFMLGPFNPLASILSQSMLLQEHTHARSVGPIITTEFPDTGHKRKRGRRPTGECSICLDPVLGRAITLPCGHVFHRICVFAILTTSTLGSDSMMRCPLCRYKLDRYDVGGGIFLCPCKRKISHRGRWESSCHPVG